jgi:methylmalonyl-CoA epimerase
MKAMLDHVGIAVADLSAALAFYRDALGLEVEAPEEVASQHVRAHFLPVGTAKLELLEATAADSPIARFTAKRGPGLHHITLRVDDIRAALAQLKARGARLIDEEPRPGAEHSLVAFVHPSSAHGVLVELKQAVGADLGRPPATAISGGGASSAPSGDVSSAPTKHVLGDLELISLFDGTIRVDGGSMFGTVPKALWETHAPADARNHIALALRPLVVRGARTMLIDAGIGDKEPAAFHERYGVDRTRSLEVTMAEAGVAPEQIDIVLASHLHFAHAGGFTYRDAGGRLRPTFPRAQYIVRRGEWEDANRAQAGSGACYLVDNFVPLADAGVLQLVDDDATIMPGIRVRRTGGHTRHHQIVLIESKAQTAAYVADLMPTSAHVRDGWAAAFDLFPIETLAAKQQFATEAIEKRTIVFFAHDPAIAAGYIREQDGKRHVIPALTRPYKQP